MSDIVIVIIVIFALLLILTLLLHYIIKRINLLSKNIFINKMEEFDYLIGDKEQKIDELNTIISKKENDILGLEDKIEKYGSIQGTSEEASDVILPKYVNLENTGVFASYKVIKDNFTFDTQNIVERFVRTHKLDDSSNNCDVYTKVRNYFTFDVLYKLSTYQEDEQFIIVSHLLDEHEKEALKPYLKKDNFNIREFLNLLDELIVKNSSQIKIIVGNRNENYDFIDSHVSTVYDDSVVEGFKIVYKGVIYDYSL